MSDKQPNAPLCCDQKDCSELAEFVFTWPGREPSKACEPHAKRAKQIADTMGFHLAITPIEQTGFPF